jgi:hypothetical protein
MVMLSHEIRERREVHPVLVVWGAGRMDIDGVRLLDGVTIVPGDSLLDWLSSRGEGAMTELEAASLYERLTRFADGRVAAGGGCTAR